MSAEIQNDGRSPIPPQWWHDAIRKNLEGFQTTPHRFESFQKISENGIYHTICSITPGDPEGLHEGIYITAKIQSGPKGVNPELFTPIVTPLIDLFYAESLKVNTRVIQPISTEYNPELARRGATTNITSSVGLTIFEEKGSEYVIIVLSPLTREDIDINTKIIDKIGEVKESVVADYFTDLTYFQRIKLEFSDEINLSLKMEILKMEIKVARMAIKHFSGKMGTGFNENEDTQFYRLFLGRILETKSHEDEQNLAKEIQEMGFARQIGWLKFYEKYWTEKLGIQITGSSS